MDIKGNLSSTSLADIFKKLQQENCSGLLRIQAPEGPRFVELQNGTITIAGRSTERILLGDLLVSRGLLDDNKLTQALALQKATGKLLGEVLIENRFLMVEHLEESLKFQIEDEIFELLTLRDGEFDFLNNAAMDVRIAPAGGLVRLHLDLNALLQEAARRADEWAMIKTRIPKPSFLFQTTADGDALLQSKDGLSLEGMLLLRLVKTHRTVEAMVQKGCLGRFNTHRMLLELWDAGIVEAAPLSTYHKVALEHLSVNRQDEALRLAGYVMEFGTPDEKKSAQELLVEIEKERKASSTTEEVNVKTNPKIRSEVIRRNQANLLLKQHRYAPWALIGVLTIGTGLGVYFYTSGSLQSAGVSAARSRLDAVSAEANAKIAEEKYGEALQLLNGFRSFDPETQSLVNEQYQRRLKDVEAKLMQAIENFNRAQKSINPEALQTAIQILQRFGGVTGMNEMVTAAYAEVRAEVDKIVDNKKIEEYRHRAKEIEASSHEKGRDEVEAAYASLLADNPPEAVAMLLRDILLRMGMERTDARRGMKHANALRDSGDTDSARMQYQRVKQLSPGSAIAAEAEKEIVKLQQTFSSSLAQLEKLEALQNKPAEARAALPEYLQANPPYSLAIRALTMLHGLSEKDESALSARLKSAQALYERSPVEARHEILQLIEKNPFSRTAATVTLKVRVNTQPEGAAVTLNGRTAGATPLTLDIPPMGMARIRLVKEGYRTEEIVHRNLRAESISSPLDRVPLISSRASIAAYRGMAVLSERLLLVGAPPFESPESVDEIAICSIQDLHISRRLRWGTKAARDIHAVQLAPFAVLNGELFIPARDPHLLRANLVSGAISQLKLMRTAKSRPELFKGKDSDQTHYIGMATEAGYESYEFEKEKSFKHVKFSRPVGAVFDGETFFISGSDKKVNAVQAGTRLNQWNAALGATLRGSPACHPPFSGTVQKGIVAFAADTGAVIALSSTDGKEKWRKKIAHPALFGVTSLNKGLLILMEDKSAQLLAPQDGETTWNTPLPGQPMLPPLVIAPGDPRKDNLIAVAVHDAENDQDFIVLLSSGGEMIWSGALIAAPVAMTASSDRLYVGLSNADIVVYDIK